MHTPRTIIFIGPQGSGKGTQVELLVKATQAKNQSVACIQTGDFLRSLAESDSYVANCIKSSLAAGQLIPDPIMDGLVVERLLSVFTADTSLVFDGYPRNQAQVKTLQEVLGFFGREHLAVIHLVTPDAEVKERMLERGRADDTPASIAVRLTTYHKQTEPLLGYFRNLSSATIHDIDGVGAVESVHEAIMQKLR